MVAALVGSSPWSDSRGLNFHPCFVKHRFDVVRVRGSSKIVDGFGCYTIFGPQ